MPEAIVVGGGIGGLSAAIALRRAKWRVTVLERRPEFGELGAGLTLMANAMRGLDALGVGDAVRAQGRVDSSGGTRTASGRWISRISADAMARSLGTSALGIHRADLHRILRTALPTDSLVGGATVTRVRPGPPAEVDYVLDGRPTTLGADLIVGADGLRSAVRSQLWPDVPGPVYAGSTAWRGLTAGRWAGELVTALSWAPGAEFGMVPLGDGRVYWFGAINAPAGGREPDEFAAVRARFGSWHQPIPRLLDETDAATVLRTDLYCLDTPLPTYVRGRVAMLGDAAHAMTPNLGQGAGQAIEDAVVLGAVCAAGSDVATALAAYDAARRPRSQQVARASRQIGRFGQQLTNPIAVGLRNALMRVTPARVALRSMARYADWQPPAV